MDVPFGGALRASPDHRRPCQIALADIDARSDADPAEIGEAPGLHGDVRQPRRLPESHRNPAARQRICASHDWCGRIVRVWLTSLTELSVADAEGEKAKQR